MLPRCGVKLCQGWQSAPPPKSRELPDLPPLRRQWLILRTLSVRRFGATVRELANEYGVSQKTVRRDLIALRDLGFSIREREGAHGRKHWVADSDESLVSLKFDVGEVLALFVSRSLLEPLAGTIFWDAAHSAFRKIKATLSDPAIEYLDKLSGLILRTSFRDSDYSEKSRIIDELMVAIEDRRMTFITYQSARSTEPLTYDVYPYGLVYHRGSLYLVAHSQQHEETRSFKVDRMSDIAMETLTFEKPAEFNLGDYLEHTLGIFHEDGQPQHVVIRFAAEVTGYVQEHHWHHSQKLTPQPDGSLLAEFDLAPLTEVKSWVLSFGAKAVVEEPEELREAILEEVRSVLSHAESLR